MIDRRIHDELLSDAWLDGGPGAAAIGRNVDRMLDAVRRHLDMDVAFVSEFNGRDRIGAAAAKSDMLDARAAAGITGDSEDDPDAIVVTAEKEKGRGREPWILIGRDVLRFCGTVELDRPGVAWVLTCQFPA